MQPKIEFIDPNSEAIYKKKEHALIGISPSNGYYTAEKIEQIVKWVSQAGFADFHFFLGEGMSFFNFSALGYSEKEAWKKTDIKDRHLHNKTAKVLQANGLSTDKIINFRAIQQRAVYQGHLEQYHAFIESDLTFKNTLNKVINALHLESSTRKTINSKIAINYFIAEMPMLLNTPEILQLPSSLFVYHQNNPLYEYLFVRQCMQAKNQGFFVLSI